MKEQSCKKALVIRSIRVHPNMSRVMREAELNVSKIARELLEEYVEEVGLNWKEEL